MWKFLQHVSNESFNLKISQIQVLHPPLIHNIHKGSHVASLLRPHHHLPYQGSARGNGSGKSFMTVISCLHPATSSIKKLETQQKGGCVELQSTLIEFGILTTNYCMGDFRFSSTLFMFISLGQNLDHFIFWAENNRSLETLSGEAQVVYRKISVQQKPC